MEGVFLWALVLKSAGHFPVHVADDLDAPLVLFFSDHGPQDCLQVLRELDDVYLIGKQRILSRLVALEEDLLDQFFTQMHFLPSTFPS